ncbi:MAG: type I phosphomannose isomerase catalytic subunit [Spirochaetales bacterium]
MYPLKFQKVLKEKIWGGREFESFLGIDLPTEAPYGESWEVSAHPNGPSVVAEGDWQGQTLPDLVAREGARLVGKANAQRFGSNFPLLIKYLDIHDKLSIQVHPDNAYALANEGEFGKSECWYVLQASPDAKLILGMAEGVDAELFALRSRAGQWKGLFREVAVQAGDFVHVTPGTVHASLTGSVLLCEIQQNSDTTYRIYDFDRLDNGKRRELHLDKALQVIRFDRPPVLTHAGQRPTEVVPGAVLEPLVHDEQYSVDRVAVNGTWALAATDNYQILSIVDGGGALVHAGKAYLVQGGETWFLPANLHVVVQGELTVLKSWT